jgi:pimeloyl-ACP methyl ester carboxylesterase
MPLERRFPLPGLTLAAREWGGADDIPVLAVHGWLDNAGSFDLLAPRLRGCRIVALDAAGHGASDFRSLDSSYNLWQDVGDAVAVADLLSWDRFRFIGHSRGAAIGTLLAGTFPERVEQLVLIEGGLPLIDPAERAPLRLAEALRAKRELASRKGRVFPDRRRAIAERAAGFSRVTIEASEILARRSLRETDGGYTWRADQRLKGPSDVRYTAEQVRAFVARVTAPVLMFRATQSPFIGTPEYIELLPSFAALETVQLEGGHHLHMEGAEAEIAERILEFFRPGGLTTGR